MVNPHVDNGVPWSPKPPSTNTSVNTTNVNFGYTGNNTNNQTNNDTQTNTDTQTQTNTDTNNQTNNVGITTLDDGTISVPEVNTFSTKPNNLSNIDDNIWELATQAYASNPGYALSFEGKKLIKLLAENTSQDGQPDPILPGDPRYQQTMVQAFGLPSIIQTSTNSYGDPIYTNDGNVIMSGQGQHLLDNYNNPTGSYDEKVQDYYDIKEANAAQQSNQNQSYGYGYDYGPGSSSGFGGGTHPLSFMRGRGRGKQIDTAMLDPRMGGIDASQTASNMLMQLGQGSKAFAMDPNTAGILAMLQG